MSHEPETPKAEKDAAPANEGQDKPKGSGSKSKRHEHIPCWYKVGLGSYLVAMLAITVWLMFVIWAAIPSENKRSPNTNSAATPTVAATPTAAPAAATATTPTGGDGRLCRVAVRVFCEENWGLLLVLVMGAMGGALYGMLGFCLHLALDDFKKCWSCWYIFRPWLGAGLALVVYVAVRGGFLTLSLNMTELSAYSTAGLAALVGMFSEQASKKLMEVFTTLFRTKADHARSRDEDRDALLDEMEHYNQIRQKIVDVGVDPRALPHENPKKG
jgi:hypothetical protein